MSDTHTPQPPLPSSALHEVATWMQRWQPERQVVPDVARSRIVAATPSGVLVYEADSVRRLVPSVRA